MRATAPVPRLTVITPAQWQPDALRAAVLRLLDVTPYGDRGWLCLQLRLERPADIAAAGWQDVICVVGRLGVAVAWNVGCAHTAAEVAACVAICARGGISRLQLPECAAPPTVWRDALAAVGLSAVALSRSCHDPQGLTIALAEGADAAFFSPIFASPSKPGVAPLGLVALAQAAQRHPGRLIALGGIDATTARAAFAAGAAGVACLRAPWGDAAAALLEACRPPQDPPPELSPAADSGCKSRRKDVSD